MAAHPFQVSTSLDFKMLVIFSLKNAERGHKLELTYFICLSCIRGTICKYENGTLKVARNAFNTGEVWKPVVGGAVASWLVRSTPERAVWVQVLPRDIVLCSWARHFTLTVPLSTQLYKWVPANRWENLTNCGEVTRTGAVEILLAASCPRNCDKLRQL